MRFYRKDPWIDFAIGATALGVYLFTLAPTITWRNQGADSGDLVAAAFTLGIPHPSGYPLYTLLAAIASHLPFGEPAKNVSAISAFAAGSAILFVARAGRATLGDGTPLARWIPASLTLAFAWAPAFWSQATIAEVNALASFFSAALYAILLSDSPRRLELGAVIFGFGLAHHLTMALLLPTAIILLGSERWSRQEYLRAAMLALLPLALYVYLPWRAAAHPPINWGDPETLSGFFWVVSGAPYRQYAFATPPGEIFTRVGFIARFLVENFTVVGMALGVWGAVRMSGDARKGRLWRAQTVAVSLLVIFALGYNSPDSFVYLVPAYMVFAFWEMYGASDLAQRLLGQERKGAEIPLSVSPKLDAELGRAGANVYGKTPRHLRYAALTAFLVLLPCYNLAANLDKMNLSYDDTAFAYAKKILTEIPSDAVIFADGDEHYFSLQYYRYVVTPEKDQVILSPSLLQYEWYFDQARAVVPSVRALTSNYVDRMAAIIDASSAQGRQVYATVQNEWFFNYALERQDKYYRIRGRQP